MGNSIKIKSSIMVRARNTYRGYNSKIWSFKNSNNAWTSRWISLLIAAETKQILCYGERAESEESALTNLFHKLGPKIHKTKG